MKYMFHVFWALFAVSASFAEEVDLSTLTGHYEAQDGDVLTGTLNGDTDKPQPYKITIADGAEVTLRDATIIGVNDENNYQWAGITCLGNCTIVLEGSNTVKGFHRFYPGIQAAKNEGEGEEYMLTIEGDGSLDASSNGWSAGIGSGRYGKSGAITISGGKVTATGGEGSVGIGSAGNGTCSDIIINGGEVTATGGHLAAGIGGSVISITISGGKVIAKGDSHAAGIGSGFVETSGNIIISGGEVTATGGYTGAGIGSGGKGKSGAITISGGKVTATGGTDAVGIGSGEKGSVGDITISGGVVTATGRDVAAGIGSSESSSVGNIVISGGKVIATGDDGAGIGSSYEGKVGDITINGGKVTATGGGSAAGIGSGYYGECGAITITNDVAKVVATGGTNAPYSVGAGNWGEAGTVTIGVDEGPIAESPYEFIPGPLLVDLSALTGDYEAEDGETLTGTLAGNYKITIADGAEVSLHDAVINGSNDKSYKWAGLTCLGNCTIDLSGSNIVTGFYGDYPGIQVAKREGEGKEYTLTIEGNGSLKASSNGSGAGIGSGKNSDAGNITINGGRVTATGGTGAAGIGGGKQGTCGDVTITNDVIKVVATKGTDAPYSIGAGYDGKAGTVTIGVDEGPIAESPYEFIPNSLVVDLSTLENDLEAKDGHVLTGTLAGNYKITIADGAEVSLHDAVINGSNDESYKWAGLTCLGNCAIVLRGSNIVTGFYENYPGIQAAKNEGDGKEYMLTIEGDGSLEASSNGNGAGIGGGYEVNCGNITISGGTVTAIGGYAAGIGSGERRTCGDISISGGNVAATGGAGAAGIGCGDRGTCGDISISGGNVAATGGAGAAGIGSGLEGTCGNITITNGVTKVVAIKRSSSYHSIGAGDEGTIGKITIGGTVMEKSVEKELFIFPAPPAKLVNFETVGSKTYAVIDGDYSGTDALNIAKDVSVDKVVFERTFPVVDGEKNYATIMFPFEIDADKIGNIAQAFSFLGIGVDKQNRKIVAVEEVDKFEAYKPYLIQFQLDETSISVDNTEPLVFKKTPTKSSAFEVAQSSDYNTLGDYVFRGVVQTKTWGAEDDEVLGTDGAAAYGFASTATTDVKVGQFARVGEGAYIRPFRGYIYKKPVPKKVKSNGDYVLRQTASIDDLPDVMDIVVVDRKKDGSKQTTVIGQFNSRTGEIRMNRTERTYDLKGRSVRDASRMAKGVYLKK